MIPGEHIPQDDLALLALRIVSPEESAVMQAHVTECSICRDELGAIGCELAMMALSVEPAEPPEGARERLLRRVAGSSKTIPAGQAPDRVVRFRYTSHWIAWGAAAALAVLAIALGTRMQMLHQRLENALDEVRAQRAESALARQVMELLSSSDAQHVILTAGKTPPTPSARAIYLASHGALVMQASNLHPLPEGKTYELWVIPANGAAPIPAGLFQPDSAGNASVVLPPLPLGIPAKAFGVTVENTGGSATPTLPIVLAGEAPRSGE